MGDSRKIWRYADDDDPLASRLCSGSATIPHPCVYKKTGPFGLSLLYCYRLLGRSVNRGLYLTIFTLLNPLALISPATFALAHKSLCDPASSSPRPRPQLLSLLLLSTLLLQGNLQESHRSSSPEAAARMTRVP